MSAMRVGSLCSGYGGLDRAVLAVFGGTVAWYAENDPVPASVFAHHHPNVPNVGDITICDWTRVEPVDVLVAGPPCQPISQAGRGLGTADERWLWADVLRAVGILRPRLAIFENPARLVTGTQPDDEGDANDSVRVEGWDDLEEYAVDPSWFGQILGTLADLGFDAEWGVLRASDVGACHGRARVFIVAADPDHIGCEGAEPEPRWDNERSDCPPPADPDSAIGGPPRGAGEAVREPGTVERSGRRDCLDWGDRWGIYELAIRHHEHVLGRRVPDPVDERGRLSPAFVEWMQMLPEGWVTGVPGLSRSAMLRMLGNGVVPLQAEAAIRQLLVLLMSHAP